MKWLKRLLSGINMDALRLSLLGGGSNRDVKEALDNQAKE